MSENTKNEKVVVVANLKSPVVGFVVAWLLGWFGIDRFYKGGILSILLGVVKLILGSFAVGIFFFTDGGHLVIFSYIVWYLLDFILVPFGIVLDNRRKLAMANNANASRSINKADIVALVIAVCVILAPMIIPMILGGAINAREDAKVAMAKSDTSSTMKIIVARVFADNIDTTKPKAPNGKSWGEWIIAISGLDTSKWAVSGNGIYPKGCDKETPLLRINPKTGDIHFNPSKLSDNASGDGFCERLRDSYAKDENKGDKVISLDGGVVEFEK